MIQCQPNIITVGKVDVAIDGESIGTFSVNEANPRVEHPLTKDQMNALMAGGTPKRDIFGNGFSTVRSHVLTATLTDGSGPILVSVDHSQSAPINEVDDTIQWSPVIQSFGDEEDAGLLQISTDIEILSDAPLVQENTNTYDVGITSTEMVAGEKTNVTITVKPKKTGVYSPMIEIPIAGFTFDNETGITENNELGAFEYLNGTTGNDHPSLFIQSVAWNVSELQTYRFKITPEDHGALDLDLRIRPLYDDTDVYRVNKTFTVMGRGNVTVNVVDETGAPVDADSITLGATPVAGKSSHDFTGILEGTYPLVVSKTGYPAIRTAARVTPDATALYNVTLPLSLANPTLVFSEGGAGSIAGVAQVPPEQLNAARNENTTYSVTVLGNGGELGVALEFPMRYLMSSPVVKVNDVETEDYELINGTFGYDTETQTYSTTNATLIVYNTTAGSNTIEIEFEGGLLGESNNDGTVDIVDALRIVLFEVRQKTSFDTYDYPDVNRDGMIDIVDALRIVRYEVKQVNEYYQ